MVDIVIEEMRIIFFLELINEKGVVLGDNGEDICLVDYVYGKDMFVYWVEK